MTVATAATLGRRVRWQEKLYRIIDVNGGLIVARSYHAPSVLTELNPDYGVEYLDGPVRYQQRRTAGWRAPDGGVYVGRGTRHGNPFKVRRVFPGWRVVDTGSRIPGPEQEAWGELATELDARKLATALFIRHTADDGAYGDQWADVDAALEPLIGADLGCWCPPTPADALAGPAFWCHADYLLERVNQYASLDAPARSTADR